MLKNIFKLVPILAIIAVLTTGCETNRSAGYSAATGIGSGYTVGNEVAARADVARGSTPYSYGSSYYYRDPFYYRY